MTMKHKYELIVMGASFGGIEALATLLARWQPPFLPVVIVQHLPPQQDSYLVEQFRHITTLTVQEVKNGDPIKRNTVYLAPPNYHVLIEENKTLSLSADEKIHFSRPSIDVLFESAADAYGASLIGVLLTGSNEDGSTGLAAIKAAGGLCIIQDPITALASTMPAAALKKTTVDLVLSLTDIAACLNNKVAD